MGRTSLRQLKKQQKSDVSTAQHLFIQGYINRYRKVKAIQAGIFLVLIALWEILTQCEIMDPFIFSSPSRMATCFIELSKDGSLFMHLGITLLETFVSFGVVTVFGIGLAILLWWNDTLSQILEPYLVVLNSLPKTALAPVFIVWLGNNMKTIIVAAVSVAVFGTVITLSSQFHSVEEDKIKLIQTLGGTKKDILLQVVLPSNVPAILSNAKVNIGLSLVGVIIGEFLAAQAGLGYLIIYGRQVFKLDYVMLSICILCIVATGLYKLLSFVEQKYLNHSF